MHNLSRRNICFALTVVLAISGLAGCGGQTESTTQTEGPSTAAELAEMYVETAGARSYHFEGKGEFSLNIMDQSLPMRVVIGGDYVDGNTHLTLGMEYMSELSVQEMYIAREGDSYIKYVSSKTDDKTQWEKTPIGSNPLNVLSSKELLSAGEFSKDGDGYAVTLTGMQVMDAMMRSDKDLENALKDVSTADLQKSLEDCKVVFAFDKAANNTSWSLSYEYVPNGPGSQIIKTSYTASANVKVAGHGKIDASKVALPESVKSSAVDATVASPDVFQKILTTITGSQSET